MILVALFPLMVSIILILMSLEGEKDKIKDFSVLFLAVMFAFYSGICIAVTQISKIPTEEQTENVVMTETDTINGNVK